MKEPTTFSERGILEIKHSSRGISRPQRELASARERGWQEESAPKHKCKGRRAIFSGLKDYSRETSTPRSGLSKASAPTVHWESHLLVRTLWAIRRSIVRHPPGERNFCLVPQ